MRDHIYRGKTKEGKWVKGFYTKTAFGKGFSDSIVVYDGGSTCPHEVIPETVGEYISSGKFWACKEICEDDIVKVPGGWIGDYRYDECLAVVYYDEQEAEFGLKDLNGDPLCNPFHWNELIVVGNITDNKVVNGRVI